MAETATPRALAQLATGAELRRRYEQGERGAVLREVLQHWDETLVHPDDFRWLEPILRSVGLSVEAFTLQSRLVNRPGVNPQDHVSFIAGVLNAGDPWWAHELLQRAGTTGRALDALKIEIALALRNPDATALIGAWLNQYTDRAAREAAVGWWVRCGQVARAERLVEQSGDLPIWHARLALWRRQTATARALLQPLPPSAERHCLEGIATALEGALQQAELVLRPLLETDVRGEAASWLATVLRKQGRFVESRQAADIATFASPEFHLVPRLNRELTSVCERAGGDNPQGYRLRALRQRLALWIRSVRRLENADAAYALGLRPRDSFLAIETALDRLAGNHSAFLTTVDGGVLSPCALPQDPRHLGAMVQRALWTRGPAATRALYHELAPTVRGHPLFRIYQGELELWMGDYEAAARVFEQALQHDRRTRWAWIGLGASQMFRGELGAAQQTWTRGLALSGEPGPTLFVYRGECYRLQGDRKRARAELETGLRQKPQRLSARMNLALLDRAPNALARVESECAAHAPFLMEQLRGTSAEKIELALEAMRGNRSSSRWHVSYHLWGRVWQCAS